MTNEQLQGLVGWLTHLRDCVKADIDRGLDRTGIVCGDDEKLTATIDVLTRLASEPGPDAAEVERCLYVAGLKQDDASHAAHVTACKTLAAEVRRLRSAKPQAAEPSSDELHRKLAAAGVFKGFEGLEGLLNKQEFWDDQSYGTRLYYGSGITEYLHRDVLRQAVNILKTPPASAPPPVPAPKFKVGDRVEWTNMLQNTFVGSITEVETDTRYVVQFDDRTVGQRGENDLRPVPTKCEGRE